MRKGYEIIFRSLDMDTKDVIEETTLLEGEITKPTNCLDFSLSHEKQIELIQKALDKITEEQTALINPYSSNLSCPKCSSKFISMGHRVSEFHDVFTDHKVKIQRLRCKKCNHELPSSIKKFFGTNLSGKLSKIQAELGAKYTFRESEDICSTFSSNRRKINNHNHIKINTEDVGNKLQEVLREEKELIKVEEAEELIVNIDGGHVKSIDPDVRSFEALTSVIYRPEALISNGKNTRNSLSSKSCAASTEKEQEEMITDTILAAIKEGMTANTHITILSDGAKNCWNIGEGLKPLCRKMTRILDWFHLSMKMENISLPEELKNKFVKIKWHLWRGNIEAAIIRLNQLIEKTKNTKIINKLEKFLTYIKNNKDKIVNYRKRKKEGLVFTSNLAESTVESLINRRCKGQQHMRWSREGLNPILQLRAKIHSEDWGMKWKTVILNCAAST